MNLRSIVIEVEGDSSYLRENFLGYYVYSFFVRQLGKIDPKKSKFYHKKNLRKPFTLSAPFLVRERIFIRVCLLEEEIFSLFVSSLFETKAISLKEKDYQIKKVYLSAEKSLPGLMRSLVKNYPVDFKLKGLRLRISTLSPFLFRTGNNYQNIPSFSLIKNSFEKKQIEIYKKIHFSIPSFVIEKVNLRSKAVRIDPFSEFIGSVGTIEIRLKEPKKDIWALEFFGLGAKTTMGLGQVILEDFE